jgi:hypothetical protein
VKRAILLCLLALAMLGCNTGRMFIASSGDYADYRAVRVAEGVDNRVAAAWEYLKARPDGRYASRLKSYFDKAEPIFFNVRSRSIKGLEAYLRALPDGPHAREALRLLGVMREERDREDITIRMVDATGRKLDTERAKREEARALLLWWIDSFMTPSLWAAPLSDAPGAFLVRYQLSLPEPVCARHPSVMNRRKCIKPFERSFKVAAAGKSGLDDRMVAFELEVELDEDWRLTQAILTGRGMLLATEEARSGKALPDTPDVRRAAAAAFVAKLTAAMFDREVACNGGTEASGKTALECEGLRLSIEPGAPGVDDVIWIERIGAPPPQPVVVQPVVVQPAPTPAPSSAPEPAPVDDPYD